MPWARDGTAERYRGTGARLLRRERSDTPSSRPQARQRRGLRRDVVADRGALLFWRTVSTYDGRGLRLLLASAAYGIAVGFRTDLAIFLAPLWLLAAWRAPLRWSAACAALVTALVAVWFFATAALGGGVAALLAALSEQGRFIDERYSVFGNGPRAIVTNAYELARYLGRAIYFLIPAAVVPVLSSDARRIELRDRRRAAFLLLWTFTPLLIYIPIHVGEYGYV